MTADKLQEVLDAICSLPGLRGCAVVDVETGMAWKAAGNEDAQILCEAASDYWRLHLRSASHYSPMLGPMAAQILVHAKGRITVVGCAGSLLHVCISDEPDRVDWARWKSMVGELRILAASI